MHIGSSPNHENAVGPSTPSCALPHYEGHQLELRSAFASKRRISRSSCLLASPSRVVLSLETISSSSLCRSANSDSWGAVAGTEGTIPNTSARPI